MRDRDVVARSEPAKVAGGDYYDFVTLPDGRLGVVIADVSGKGLPAALIMPAVKIALRTLAERDADSGSLLAELNRILLDNLRERAEERVLTPFLTGEPDPARERRERAAARGLGLRRKDGRDMRIRRIALAAAVAAADSSRSATAWGPRARSSCVARTTR